MGALFSALSPREEIVGLDLDSGLAVAASVYLDRSGFPHLKKAAWCEYNPKASQETIASSIRRMWIKNDLGSFSTASSLRSRSIVLKHFQYNSISEDELASALQLEAEEALLSTPENVAFDWHLNDCDDYDTAMPMFSGTLVALPQSEIDEHLSILKHAALYPVAVGTSCMAAASLFKLCHADTVSADGAVCLTRVGRRSADIAVIYGRNSIYPRTVFVHASQAGNPAKYFAESIKDVLSYCNFKLHLPEVEKLYITGVVDESLQSEVADSSGIEVVVWDPLADLAGANSRIFSRLQAAGPEVCGGLISAMGLALENY